MSLRGADRGELPCARSVDAFGVLIVKFLCDFRGLRVVPKRKSAKNLSSRAMHGGALGRYIASKAKPLTSDFTYQALGDTDGESQGIPAAAGMLRRLQEDSCQNQHLDQ